MTVCKDVLLYYYCVQYGEGPLVMSTPIYFLADKLYFNPAMNVAYQTNPVKPKAKIKCLTHLNSRPLHLINVP